MTQSSRGLFVAAGYCQRTVRLRKFVHARFTFASLSAARCADIELGCNATPSRLVACGSADSAHDRLGSAMRLSGAMAELADEREDSDLCVEDMICMQKLKSRDEMELEVRGPQSLREIVHKSR